MNYRSLLTTCAAAVAVLGLVAAPLHAGDSKTAVDPKELGVKAAAEDYDWSIELGSGAAFSNVRESHLDGYTYIPVNATAALKIDDVSLDNQLGGILRGYTEFLFQGYYDQIVNGPSGENYIAGANFGPRYNFVQPGWKVVPYVQGLVGFGFADSNPTVVGGSAHGLGQDFNFTFGVGVGVRYDINDRWFTRVGAAYTHFSNAGLSEPAHPNRAIDAVGPQVGVGYRF
ncbi:MAG: acyloxyacyl hydrolase [Verrucomicrobium sp.]|nr:acyloxyacyl hydrolase [Verrucomicrobium sp.]